MNYIQENNQSGFTRFNNWVFNHFITIFNRGFAVILLCSIQFVLIEGFIFLMRAKLDSQSVMQIRNMLFISVTIARYLLMLSAYFYLRSRFAVRAYSKDSNNSYLRGRVFANFVWGMFFFLLGCSLLFVMFVL